MSIFYAASPQVQRVQKVQKVQRVVGKVLKIDRPVGRRVLKFDGPTGRGLWYRPAGDEFYNSASQNGKPNNRASPDGNAPLLPTAPLHRKACHWIFGSFHSPTNPVPLPPRRGKFALLSAFGLIRCEQHFSELATSGGSPPIRLRRTSPQESVSLGSQVALLPYEPSSLATPIQRAE